MSGGIRRSCRRCNTRLENGSCPNCGWSYEKEFGGQQEIAAKTDSQKEKGKE